jgi:hypothetical protein
MLFASLTSTWAVRVLHHQYQAIYQPDWLRRVLDVIGPRLRNHGDHDVHPA